MTPSEVSNIVAIVIETLRQAGMLASSHESSKAQQFVQDASLSQAVASAAQSLSPQQAGSSHGCDALLAALGKYCQPDGTVDLSLVACELGVSRQAVLMRINTAERRGELRYTRGRGGDFGAVQFTMRERPTLSRIEHPFTHQGQNASGASETPEGVKGVKGSTLSRITSPFTHQPSERASALSSEAHLARQIESQGKRTSAQPGEERTDNVIATIGAGIQVERGRIAKEVRARINGELLSGACQRWAKEPGRLMRSVRTKAGDRRQVEGVDTGGTRAAWDADFASRIAQSDVKPALLAVAIARADAVKASNSLGFVATCLGIAGPRKPLQLHFSEAEKVKHWEERERQTVEHAVASSRMLAIAKQVEAKAKAGGGA